MDFFVDDFLLLLRKDSYLSNNDSDYDDDALLDTANWQIRRVIAPVLKELDSNFYLEPVGGNFVLGQQDYVLPPYAMWHSVRIVERINGDRVDPLTYLSIDELRTERWQYLKPGIPQGYFFKHDSIGFVPIPSFNSIGADFSYRLWIYRRPGKMVKKEKGREILLVDKTTGVVTYTSPPPPTFTASSTHDFYLGISPFKRLGDNIKATAQAGATQTFPVAAVQNLNPGDWACILDETVFPPLPPELQEWLVDATDLRISKSKMDTEKFSLLYQQVKEEISSIMRTPGNRNQGEAKTLSLAGNGLVTRILSRGRGWY